LNILAQAESSDGIVRVVIIGLFVAFWVAGQVISVMRKKATREPESSEPEGLEQSPVEVRQEVEQSRQQQAGSTRATSVGNQMSTRGMTQGSSIPRYDPGERAPSRYEDERRPTGVSPSPISEPSAQQPTVPRGETNQQRRRREEKQQRRNPKRTAGPVSPTTQVFQKAVQQRAVLGDADSSAYSDRTTRPEFVPKDFAEQADLAYAQPAGKRKTDDVSLSLRIRGLLTGNSIRDAVLLNEVLSKPVSLRDE